MWALWDSTNLAAVCWREISVSLRSRKRRKPERSPSAWVLATWLDRTSATCSIQEGIILSSRKRRMSGCNLKETELNLKETELLHDRSSKEDISFKIEDVLAAPFMYYYNCCGFFTFSSNCARWSAASGITVRPPLLETDGAVQSLVIHLGALQNHGGRLHHVVRRALHN